MWRLGLRVKAEERALGVNEKQTFLGHLMLRRWVIGPLDVCDALGKECALSVWTVSRSVYGPFLIFTRAVSVALWTMMTTSQSSILVQMQVLWQWVNPNNFRAGVNSPEWKDCRWSNCLCTVYCVLWCVSNQMFLMLDLCIQLAPRRSRGPHSPVAQPRVTCAQRNVSFWSVRADAAVSEVAVSSHWYQDCQCGVLLLINNPLDKARRSILEQMLKSN